MQIKTVNVPVVFELGFSPASGDLVPCLVGSLKELGTWNRLNGIVAKKIDEDSSKWTVELEIPQMSFFFFNWTMTKNGQFYEEEPTGCRKANVGVFGGVFKSKYGEKWTEFSSFCGCQISVSTHYALNYDEQIVVMGSGKLLGDWKTWVPAASDDPETSVWTAKFELEQGTTVEFKWVILDRQTRDIRRWQEGENRIIKIETGLNIKNVFVPWGGRFVKEGLIIPAITVRDWSDYHPERLSRSFAIGYDDDDTETNNSNMEDTKLALELVPSVGNGQYVARRFLKATNNDEMEIPFQNLLKPCPEEPRASSSAAKFYYNHARTIVSRIPILDDDTDLLERVTFLDGGLDSKKRVAVLDGSLDQGAGKLEITFSDDMVTELQSTQVHVVVEANTDEHWSRPRKALFSVFAGLSNFCSRFVF